MYLLFSRLRRQLRRVDAGEATFSDTFPPFLSLSIGPKDKYALSTWYTLAGCFVLTAILVFCSAGYGQEVIWERLFDDDELPPDSADYACVPFSLLEHDDYGFVVGAWHSHYRYWDAETLAVWVFQTDWEGETVWDYRIEGREDARIDRYSKLEKTLDGEHILLVRISDENGPYFPMLIWLDYDGMEIIRRSYPSIRFDLSYTNDLLVAEDGKIIILSSRPRFILILDDNGDSLAYRDYNLPEDVGCYGFRSICQTAENRFLIRGTFSGQQRYCPLFLEIDEQGDSVRGKIFDWDEDRRIEEVIPTDSGTLLACGKEGQYDGLNYDSTDATLMEFGRDWELLWSKIYNLSDFDYIRDLKQLSDGRIVCVGNTYDADGDQYGWLLLTDETGDSLDSFLYRELGKTSFDFCLSLNDDSELIIAGSVSDSLPNNGFVWIRTLLMNVGLPPVSAGDPDYSIPSNFSVFPAYPNPFNSMVTVPFSVDRFQPVGIMVYDAQGRSVYCQTAAAFTPGSHTFTWKPDAYPAVTSGTYFIRFNSINNDVVLPVSLVK